MDYLDIIYILLHIYLIGVTLYISWTYYLLPKLKGEKTTEELLNDFVEETTLEDDCKLTGSREATLKERFYFQKVSGAFFFIFLLIAFFIFLGLLTSYSLFDSLSFIFLSIIVLYLKLNSDLKKTGQKSKFVKIIEGTVRKINLTNNKVITVGQEDYHLADEFENIPQYNEKVRLEIYDNYEVIKINDEYLFENKKLKNIKENSSYHKVIAVSFAICTTISFVTFFDSTQIKLGINHLFLEKKNQEYINKNSILQDKPKVGQVITLSGYRVCEGTSYIYESCGNFMMDNKPFVYERNKDIEQYYENIKKLTEVKRLKDSQNPYLAAFGKKYFIINNIDEYLNLLQNIKNIEFLPKNRFSVGNSKTVVKFNYDNNEAINLYNYLEAACSMTHTCKNKRQIYLSYKRSEYYYFKQLQASLNYRLLDYEADILTKQIKNYIASNKSKVWIKYLDTNFMPYDEKNYKDAKTYDKLYASFEDTIRLYGKEFIVYDEKINAKDDYVITVIPYDNSEYFKEGQLILAYLILMSLLTLTHIFLGYKKRAEK